MGWQDAPLSIETTQPTKSGWKNAPLVQSEVSKPKEDLYSLWGMKPSKEFAEKYPYRTAGIQTIQDVAYTPLLHFLNVAGLNRPRAMAEEMGYQYPQGSSPQAELLARTAGAAGGIVSPITGALGAIAGAGGKAAPLLQKMGLGALAGGLGGAAYTPTEDTPMQMATRATGGAILGAGTSLIGSGIQKIGEMRARSKQLTQLQKQYMAEQKGDIPHKIGVKIQESKDELAQHKEDFSKQLNVLADTDARNVKPKIKDFGTKLSESYEKGADEIDNILLGQDTPIVMTADEVGTGIIENALNKVSPNSKEAMKLASIAKRNGFDASYIQDYEGNFVWSVRPTEANMSKQISFKDIIDVKNTFKKDAGDAYRAFRDSMGEFLSDETRFPSQIAQKYKDLQSNYAPLANAKWEAYKIFRPWEAGDVNTTRATNFFKKLAVGDLELDKQRLLRMLEKGSEFSPGIGDISSKIKSFGESGIKDERSLTRFITDLVDKKERVGDLLSAQKRDLGRAKTISKILVFLGLAGGTAAGISNLRRVPRQNY